MPACSSCLTALALPAFALALPVLQELGTYHVRTTILPPEADMAAVAEKFTAFHKASSGRCGRQHSLQTSRGVPCGLCVRVPCLLSCHWPLTGACPLAGTHFLSFRASWPNMMAAPDHLHRTAPRLFVRVDGQPTSCRPACISFIHNQPYSTQASPPNAPHQMCLIFTLYAVIFRAVCSLPWILPGDTP